MYGVDARFWCEKRPLLRPMCTYDNIKIDIQLVECVEIDWIDLGQDREVWRVLVNAGTHFQVPKYAWNFVNG
jgi:hypothetical protein